MKARYTMPCIVLALSLSAANADTDPTAIDVCQKVPGAEVARLFGKSFKEAKPSVDAGNFSRCTYLVTETDGKAVPGYSLWLYPASEYEALLEYTEGIIEKPQSFGDAAVLFRGDDGLYKLRLLVQSRFALEAVATDADAARKLARHALGVLSR